MKLNRVWKFPAKFPSKPWFPAMFQNHVPTPVMFQNHVPVPPMYQNLKRPKYLPEKRVQNTDSGFRMLQLLICFQKSGQVFQSVGFQRGRSNLNNEVKIGISQARSGTNIPESIKQTFSFLENSNCSINNSTTISEISDIPPIPVSGHAMPSGSLTLNLWIPKLTLVYN